MKKYNDYLNQVNNKNSQVGATLADDMLDHVSGGAAWGRLWIRIIIIIRR
jgi:hypothetical protein